MRAISLHQPWATLVAIGAKKIETRHWATDYRGELLIHAARNQRYVGIDFDSPLGKVATELGSEWQEMVGKTLRRAGFEPGRVSFRFGPMDPEGFNPLPLGAFVARCRLADCLPIVNGRMTGAISQPYLLVYGDGVLGICRHEDEFAEWVDAEKSFGDFTPGRFAWVLEDVEGIWPPVPAKGHQRFWNAKLPSKP